MFDMTDSENESDTSMLPKSMGDIPNDSRFLPHPPPAAAASFLDKKDTCIQQGQILKRWHSVPRLVTLMPAIGDCPAPRLTQQGLTVDRSDNWRDKEGTYHRPFEYNPNGDSSDGDYCPSRWTGYTESWIREDCAPATQWTGERLLSEYCCGPQSRIGDPKNAVDNPCKVIRYTEKKDVRTNGGLRIALRDINTFKGKH
eukprot:3288556-Pyramimonas_sp.AAC.1